MFEAFPRAALLLICSGLCACSLDLEPMALPGQPGALPAADVGAFGPGVGGGGPQAMGTGGAGVATGGLPADVGAGGSTAPLPGGGGLAPAPAIPAAPAGGAYGACDAGQTCPAGLSCLDVLQLPIMLSLGNLQCSSACQQATDCPATGLGTEVCRLGVCAADCTVTGLCPQGMLCASLNEQGTERICNYLPSGGP